MEMNDDRESKIYFACSTDRPGNLGTILREYPVLNLDKVILDKQTPLHIACEFGSLQIVEFLLEYNASVEVFDDGGKTPLHVACEQGFLDIVNLLIEKNSNIEAFDEDRNTPLILASMEGRADIVKELLKRNANIEAHNRSNQTALYFSCYLGHIRVCELLLEKNACVDVKTVTNKTPLMAACASGNLDTVKLILGKTASNLNTRASDGRSALFVAVEEGHLDIAMLLLEKNAEIMITNGDGFTPLHVAIIKGYTDFAIQLIEKISSSVNLAEVEELSKTSPLHLACYKGYSEIVNMLVSRKFNIDDKDEFAWTPLEIARSKGYCDIVKLFIEKNAVVDESNISQLFEFCITHQRTDIAILIFSRPQSPFKPLNRIGYFNYMLTNHFLIDRNFYKILLMRMGATEENIDSLDLALIDSDRGLFPILLYEISRDDGRTVLDHLAIHYPELKGGVLTNLIEKVPLDTLRLHFCGPGCGGKTTLKYQLQQNLSSLEHLNKKPINVTRTNGIEIESSFVLNAESSRPVMFTIFDHGGQQEFHVTYNEMLTYPMSVFLIVIPVTTSTVYDKSHIPIEFLSRSTPFSVCEQLKHWLSILSLLVHPLNSRIVIVLNTFGECDESFLTPIVNACSNILKECKESNKDLGEKIVYEDDRSHKPIILSCLSGEVVNSHFQPCLKKAVKSLLTVEFKIPKLCDTIIKKINNERLEQCGQETKNRIIDRKTFYQNLREFDVSLRFLSDQSISILLQYVEQKGKILLLTDLDQKNGESVILDPNWFCCSVLGSLFQYEYFEGRRNMIQSENSIRDHLSNFGVLKEQVELVIVLLHKMRLCVPLAMDGSSENVCFMSFMEHHEFSKRYGMKQLNQEHLIEDFKEALNEGRNDLVCGRLISLTDLDIEDGKFFFNKFLPGTFSRFQMLVTEAFWEVAKNSYKRYILSVAPFYLRISYQSNGDYAELFMQMMLDPKTNIQTHCRMWLRASPFSASQRLLETNLITEECKDSRNYDLFTPDRVFEQFLIWFEKSTEVCNKRPHIFLYCIDPKAIRMTHLDAMKTENRSRLHFQLSVTRQGLEQNPSDETFLFRLIGIKQMLAQETLKKEKEIISPPIHHNQTPPIHHNQNVKLQNVEVLNLIDQVHRVNREQPNMIPPWFVLMPAKSTNTTMIFRPLCWFTTHFKLFFVCPVTGKPCATNDGHGYDLYFPTDWTNCYGSQLKLLLYVLKIVLEIVFQIMGIQFFENLLNLILNDLDKAMETAKLREILKEAADHFSTEIVANFNDLALDLKPDELKEASHRALNTEIQKMDPGLASCGLKWIQSDILGVGAMWVSEEGEMKFIKEGEKALILK